MNSYRTEVIEDEAKRLFSKYNLDGWSFQWDTAIRRYGCCYTGRRVISMSKKLVELNPLEQSLDTLLHELAHALTPGHNHDRVWQLKCIEIGARPERCYRSDKVVQPVRKWLNVCPNCNYTFPSQRRKKTSACGKCCRAYNNNAYSEKYEFVVKPNPEYKK